MDQLTTYEGLAAVSSMKARVEAVEWRDLMIEIAASPKNMRVRLMMQFAAQGVAPYSTIRNKFYAYQKQGDGALIDRRRCRAMNGRNPWVECYMTYIECIGTISWRSGLLQLKTVLSMIHIHVLSHILSDPIRVQRLLEGSSGLRMP